jgi:two-component system sensor histidine kinase DesK
VLVWLVFVCIPVVDAARSRDSGLAKALVLFGAVVFVLVFVGLVVAPERPFEPRRGVAALILLLALALALTIGDRQDWVTLFIYTAAAGPSLLPGRLGTGAVVLSAVLVPLSLLVDDAGAGSILGYTTSVAGIGMLMLALADLRAKNAELEDARTELARLAVAAERERFARDLHDLLGHSLSVIALKAELAGRLLAREPTDAEREIAEVQSVARKALGEVRDAVGGYRQPELEDELEGARVALSAAGVRAEVRRGGVALAPEVEAILAWTVREGATNVIRHSCARTCTVTIDSDQAGARAEVRDDGLGAAAGRPQRPSNGHGLEGLAQRAASLGGRLEAGPLDSGGFRVAVTIPSGGPAEADPGAASAPPEPSRL